MIVAEAYSPHAAGSLHHDSTDHHVGNWAQPQQGNTSALCHRVVRWPYRKALHHVQSKTGLQSNPGQLHLLTLHHVMEDGDSHKRVLTRLERSSKLPSKERRNSSHSGTHLRQTGGFFVPA